MGKVTKTISKAAWLKLAKKFIGDNAKLIALASEAVRYVGKKRGGMAEIKDDVLLLCNYVRDVATGRYKGYKVWHLTVIVAAIIYLISPIDVIPDFMVGGFLDDMSVIAWAFSQVGKELQTYRNFSATSPSLEPERPALPAK